MTVHTDPLMLYKSPESYAVMRDFYDSSLAKIDVEHESQYVDTRYGKTHMLAAGPVDGPPLLLMQGLAGSAILWHQQLGDFSVKHRVYALDIPGQPGRSDPNPPSLFDDGYVQWLVDVMDGLQIEQADMAGVSLGGWVIMRLGINAPERVRKAVLLSPMRLARAKLDINRYVRNGMRRETDDDKLEDRLTVREFSPSEGNQEFDRQLARAMALATKHFRLGVALGMQPDASRLTKFNVGLRALRQFMAAAPDSELSAFKVPAMLVLGEHEMLYDSGRAAARAQKLMPQLRVEIVYGSGHAFMYDQPEYVNPLILDFLDS